VVVLLPESAELRMVKFFGAISYNRIEFTHWRAFETQIALNFDAPDFLVKWHLASGPPRP
jgi:hypothetical protein